MLSLCVFYFVIQEEEAFKVQISQLRSQIQEQENVNASLSSELHKISESKLTRDEENEMLRNKISHFEKQIIHLESQVSRLGELEKQVRNLESQNAVLKERSEKSKDLTRQLEVSFVFLFS